MDAKFGAAYVHTKVFTDREFQEFHREREREKG